MHRHFFELHYGHLTAKATAIAERHGGNHVNTTEADGRRRGWFEVPDDGSDAMRRRIARIRRDIAAAGGIEALTFRRDLARA
jgi:hypothetical protein